MCGRTYFSIPLEKLKEKYHCKKIVNGNKLTAGLISRKNYAPIIYEKQREEQDCGSNEDSEEPLLKKQTIIETSHLKEGTDEADKEKEIKTNGKNNDKEIIIHVGSWGINPAFNPNISTEAILINARLETINKKKSFSGLIDKYRCAIIMNGYFEWQSPNLDTGKRKKIPYYIFLKHETKKEETDEKKQITTEEKIEKKEENGEINVKEENGETNVKEENGETNIKEENSETKVKEENRETYVMEENRETNVKEENKETSVQEENGETNVKEEETNRKRKLTPNENGENKKIKTETFEENETSETDIEKNKNIILAGLYVKPKDENDDCKYVVITTSSEDSSVESIHERCPFLLSEKTLPLWLNTEKKFSEILNDIKKEHRIICKQLEAKEVTDWNEYSSSDNTTKKHQRNSITRYFKK